VSAAVFGLIGVIVGGVLNGFVSYVLERRNERRAARTAARLLLDEWRPLVFLVADVLRLGRWRPGEQPITFEEWSRHRELLANQLSQEAWLRVSNARVHVAWIDRANHSGEAMDPDIRGELERRWQVVSDAIYAALMPVAVHGPQRRAIPRLYWRLRARVSADARTTEAAGQTTGPPRAPRD
jgi:hypothetical protein